MLVRFSPFNILIFKINCEIKRSMGYNRYKERVSQEVGALWSGIG